TRPPSSFPESAFRPSPLPGPRRPGFCQAPRPGALGGPEKVGRPLFRASAGRYVHLYTGHQPSMARHERDPPEDRAVPAAASLADLQAKARAIRKDIILSTTAAGSGHPTSSLSAVEVATALYFGGILRYDPKNPHWPQRDRFILSKGH